MWWVLFGMFLGGSWVLAAQDAPWMLGPLDSLIESISRSGAGAAQSIVELFGVTSDPVTIHAAGAVAAVLAPGIACLLAAEAAGAVHRVRNTAAGLVTLAGFCSFFWLPGHEALALLLAAMVFDVLLAFGTNLLLRLPVAVIVTAAAGQLALDVYHGAARFTPQATALARIVGDVDLCRVGLSALALVLAFQSLRQLTTKS